MLFLETNSSMVPKSLQQPSHAYPPHNETGLEEYCYQHLSLAKTSTTYLPILWTNNYVVQQRQDKTSGFNIVPEAQAYVDQLDPNKLYATVVQCADGIYENLSSNVTVFGAGGVGDIPIPLVCTPHKSRTLNHEKDLLASFVGSIECGGPVETVGKPKGSSWNANGAGAKIRREMVKVFADQSEFFVTGPADTSTFRQIMSRSVFALAPRGYGRTSFRLYEAMELGCIPVYIYDEPWLPYEDVLDWSTFCVLCSKDELRFLPAKLRAISQLWIDQARVNLQHLIPQYFSLPGVVVQLKRMIGQL